jgi:glycosyltransferase involved in cell wall biosynthesis
MIALLAKNARAEVFFEELARLDSRYRYLGKAQIDRAALVKGALMSLSSDIRLMKLDARRSPQAAQSLTESCERLLAAASEPLEGVIYWGATNEPFSEGRFAVPYFIITDGPYDPSDPIYPQEWVPRKWPDKYVELQGRIYRRAAAVFCLSNWAREKLLKVHDLDPDKVVRIGWGPLGTIGAPAPPPPDGKKLFVSIGSPWQLKNMHLIAEAGERVHKQRPDVVTVVGGKPDGPTPPSRQGVIQMPSVVPLLVGQALMRQATALLITSSFDASPHVVYEALQYGTPVIGTRVCGIPEAIEEPNGGIVIERPDTDLIERAMLAILDQDPEEQRKRALETYVRSGGWTRSAEIVHQTVTSFMPSKATVGPGGAS